MATTNSPSILFSLLLLFSVALAGKRHNPSELLRPRLKLGKEKMSHLHFYFHDIVSGSNPTAVQVASAPTTHSSATGFGAVVMIDDPLTEGPEPKSKLVGRAQGIYASASLEMVGLLMAMNFAFVDGKYNGSTLSVLGRNAVFDDVREMPVIGGSGLFRFARGYALAHSHLFDLKTGKASSLGNTIHMHSGKSHA